MANRQGLSLRIMRRGSCAGAVISALSPSYRLTTLRLPATATGGAGRGLTPCAKSGRAARTPTCRAVGSTNMQSQTDSTVAGAQSVDYRAPRFDARRLPAARQPRPRCRGWSSAHRARSGTDRRSARAPARCAAAGPQTTPLPLADRGVIPGREPQDHLMCASCVGGPSTASEYGAMPILTSDIL